MTGNSSSVKRQKLNIQKTELTRFNSVPVENYQELVQKLIHSQIENSHLKSENKKLQECVDFLKTVNQEMLRSKSNFSQKLNNAARTNLEIFREVLELQDQLVQQNIQLKLENYILKQARK